MSVTQPHTPFPDTAGTERQAYLRRLRTEPGFLLRHVPTLSGAVLRRIRTRLYTKLSRTHQARKSEPPWLDNAVPSVASPDAWSAGPLTLPTYASGHPVWAGASAMVSRAKSNDPEDYLAVHRWSALINALLEGSDDWQDQLAACVRWLDDHYDRSDPAWEPYSSCERVANLLVFLAVMQKSPRAPAIPPRLAVFLQDSLAWIRQHLEYYGPARTNNHIINNARAMVMAAVALRDARACAAGIQIMRQCLPRLIMEGGFLRERSSHYQVIVLNWLLDTWQFLGAGEDAEGEARDFLVDYIRRMIAATAMLCERGARLLALIGDVSPDLTPAQSLARLHRLYPEFWPPRENPPAGAIRDGWFRMVSGQSIVLGNFPPGAFPTKFPTHGHGDLTSFAWLHDGAEILVDRGRYRYTADATSAFQRSAAGHNVPLVNGFAPLCESLLAAGQWWPLPYAAARLEASVNGAEMMLTHDGFARATPVERHSRRLQLDLDMLTVLDSFDGEGDAELGFCWHFGDWLDRFDAQHLTVSGGDRSVVLKVEGVPGLPRSTFLGAREGAWVSRTYGERQPAPAVYLYWRVRLPVQISTRFCVGSVR